MRSAVLALSALAFGTSAGAMPVSTFLAKMDNLAKAGALATMTSDAALVKKELQDDAATLRAERMAAEQAGKAPAYCPDTSGSLSLEEIVGGLKAVPAAEQGKTEVKDALRALMAKRFPCAH